VWWRAPCVCKQPRWERVSCTSWARAPPPNHAQAEKDSNHPNRPLYSELARVAAGVVDPSRPRKKKQGGACERVCAFLSGMTAPCANLLVRRRFPCFGPTCLFQASQPPLRQLPCVLTAATFVAFAVRR
jgi:hypothetical protein